MKENLLKIFYSINQYIQNFIMHFSFFLASYLNINKFLIFDTVILFVIFTNIYIFNRILNPDKYLYIYIILKFPGTILHELTHTIGNLLFKNKIQKINLIPQITKRKNRINIKLGYVKARSNFKGSMIISSVLPLFIIPIIVFYLVKFIYFDTNFDIIFKNLTIFFILIFLLPSSLLSKQDLKVFFEHLYSISGLIIFLIFICGYYFFIKKYFYYEITNFFIKNLNFISELLLELILFNFFLFFLKKIF